MNTQQLKELVTKGQQIGKPVFLGADELSNLIERMEAAERERDELRERLAIVREQRDAELNKSTQFEAGEPFGFLRVVCGRSFQIMEGATRPPERSGENVGPWFAVYTTPPAASVPDGLVAAVNRLLDSDGSRGTFSAIRRSDALKDVERLLAAAPAPGGDGVKQG